LERSSLSSRIVFAGIDISLNLEDNIIVGWQPHIYALIEGKNTRQLQEAIKAAFPPEPTAAMPYDFDQVTDPARGSPICLRRFSKDDLATPPPAAMPERASSRSNGMNNESSSCSWINTQSMHG